MAKRHITYGRFGSIVLKNSKSEERWFSANYRVIGKSYAIDALGCTRGFLANFLLF